MRKVLVAFSGGDFSDSVFEFARKLNEISPVLLTGFFLPEIVNPPHELHVYRASEEGEKIVADNIKKFTKLCDQYKMCHRIHIGTYELPLPQLLNETRFSDLFIASSKIFFRSAANEDAHYYFNKSLHQSECPLIIVHEQNEFPEHIILAYDGSESSVYAIKQFAYLFPELTTRKTVLVYVNDKSNAAIPHQLEIEELVNAHFSNVECFKLTTEPGKYFNTWLADKNKSLLVTGSFSRSGVSEMIRKSFTKKVIEEHAAPVFITHY